ncbi:hypothetical protein KII97_02450 [Leuconostoc gelidum subsp. gasicomitatum]|uniref:hypothetical protein n=1 Tax=Leuconostoc gasicomitatum TaxID=115778 RepID=UPI001CC36208|nr:hypothetical protein [Leuconostoc gasicomitatum]MBZ5995368.1 hypothetical protein [Leuconostoc gasicomitatum]
MSKQVTLWADKNGDGYAPLTPEYVNYASESGNVYDVTEALGEDIADTDKLLSIYKTVDEEMSKAGLKVRFTEVLLKLYEPKIVDMTDDQYSQWRRNCEEEQ